MDKAELTNLKRFLKKSAGTKFETSHNIMRFYSIDNHLVLHSENTSTTIYDGDLRDYIKSHENKEGVYNLSILDGFLRKIAIDSILKTL